MKHLSKLERKLLNQYGPDYPIEKLELQNFDTKLLSKKRKDRAKVARSWYEIHGDDWFEIFEEAEGEIRRLQRDDPLFKRINGRDRSWDRQDLRKRIVAAIVSRRRDQAEFGDVWNEISKAIDSEHLRQRPEDAGVPDYSLPPDGRDVLRKVRKAIMEDYRSKRNLKPEHDGGVPVAGDP